MEAVRYLEDVVVAAGGAVVRYGGLYGPGATDDQVELVRKRQYPLVGSGAGYSSWVHVDDAASATVLVVEEKASGLFNIVDDDPAPAAVWLPYLAACAGAKPPMRVPAAVLDRLPDPWSVTEAADAVQETWLRYAASAARPASAGRSTSSAGESRRSGR
jgi:nucleoside-diphosphate-sugar epimerase